MITNFKLYENKIDDYLILEVHFDNGLPGIPSGSYIIFESDDMETFKITKMNHTTNIFGFNNTISADELYNFLEKVEKYSYRDEDDYLEFLKNCFPEKYDTYISNKKAKEFNL